MGLTWGAAVFWVFGTDVMMTVATTVASLLPILWSNQTGSEVMQPLAAPVVGGSISSLLHILVVTPVIFAWLHGRKLSA